MDVRLEGSVLGLILKRPMCSMIWVYMLVKWDASAYSDILKLSISKILGR